MKSAYEAEQEMARFVWIGLLIIVVLGTLWMFGLL